MPRTDRVQQQVSILGCRGVPAAHGGFETFAEQLSLYLAARGWDISVYCQDEAAPGRSISEDRWRGIRRIHIGSRDGGSLGSIGFDCRSMVHACQRPGILLVLGYNTGFLSLLPRIIGKPTIINMDGIEWKRSKWSPIVKLWFWLNEHIAAFAGSVLIADHPEIAAHLAGRSHAGKIATIPYGSEPVEGASTEPLSVHGLAPDGYALTVCRVEPENSVLEIVRAFGMASVQGRRLVVVGALDPGNAYHAAGRGPAGSNVVFPGSIYDRAVMDSLRVHARAYCHGHTVGGTNPSLVEALAVGSAVIAHDNRFNRWTAGRDQFYFADVDTCAAVFNRAFADDALIAQARAAARARFEAAFTLQPNLRLYEELIAEVQHHQGRAVASPRLTQP